MRGYLPPNAPTKGKKPPAKKKATAGQADDAAAAPLPSASDKIVADLLQALKKKKPPPLKMPVAGAASSSGEEEEEPVYTKASGYDPSGAVTLGVKKWAEVPAIGKVIENTRFVCFKTPIDNALPTNPDYNMFTTDQLLDEHVTSQGRTLGLVVDLTDTYKFYNPYDAFEKKEIKHVKMFLPGIDVLPRPEKVMQFNDIVMRFIKDTEGQPDRNGEDTLVGVHCNQGINMTAFMVLQFMITKMFRNQTKAIVAWEKARGAPISSEMVKEQLKALTPFRAPEFANQKAAPAAPSTPRQAQCLPGFAKEVKPK